MAVTQTAIPAAELTARAADATVVVGKNLLRIANTIAAANLITNEDGRISVADTSAAGFDRRLLADGLRNTLWKGVNGALHFIILDLGAVGHDVDTLVIEGHNWGGQTVTVEADNTTTPTAGAGAWGTEIWAGFAVSGTTLVFKLQAANMTQSRYWRIKIAGAALTPQATQVWLGKAIQFPTRPLLKGDLPASAVGGFIEVETRGGISYRYRTRGALVVRVLSWVVAQVYNSTFWTDLETWFTATTSLDGGLRSFWYVDDPTTTPTGAKFVRLTDPEFRPKQLGKSTAISFEIAEVGS